jgi:phosphoglycolate phosphatase
MSLAALERQGECEVYMSREFPIVALFDVDGTLIRTEGKSRHSRAFLGAFRRVHGVDCSFEKEMHGMTDRQIFRELAIGLGIEDGRLDNVTDEACRVMLELYRVADEMDGRYLALPGAVEAVETLLRRGVTLGLVTGNDPEIARDKLTAARLAHYFPFGAFGTEADDRTALPPLAIARAEAHLGREVSRRGVFIIGDTHRDVACAVENGCRAIAVTTGHVSADRLEAAGAELILPGLEDIDPLLRLMEAEMMAKREG